MSINTALANQQVDAEGTDLNSGFIDIYDGTMPSSDDPPDGNLLASIPLDADAYGAASGAVGAIPSAVSANAVAGGTATYAQQRNADNTRWMYAPVDTTPAAGVVSLSTTTINFGDPVVINTSTLTQLLS